MDLCKCGCGGEVSKEGNRYISGHHMKGIKGPNHPNYGKRKYPEVAKEDMELCMCGCGGRVDNVRNKYIFGHYWKGKKKPNFSGPNHPFYGKKRPEMTGVNHPLYGKERSPEWRANMSEIMKKDNPAKRPEVRAKISATMTGKKRPELAGRNHYGWVGGDRNYWHEKARELFGKDKCEHCGMTNEDHVKHYKNGLHMHNALDPKDYRVMEESAWETVCVSCHTIVEKTLCA